MPRRLIRALPFVFVPFFSPGCSNFGAQLSATVENGRGLPVVDGEVLFEAGGAPLLLSASVTGGVGTLSYSWSPAADLSSPNASTTEAAPTTTTLYELTVTDSLGNAATSRILITVVECVQDESCDDANPCTIDFCDDFSCKHSEGEAPCDDGDRCSTDDVCVAGVCMGTPVECDDGLFCNGTETCTDGSCKDGPPPCSLEFCDESGHRCMCTMDTDCETGNPCQKSRCANGACRSTDLPGPCDDGDPCTRQDCCTAGECVGIPMNCDDVNACTSDSCFQGSCKHVPLMGCQACAKSLDCDDLNPCTIDTCDDGVCRSDPFPGCPVAVAGEDIVVVDDNDDGEEAVGLDGSRSSDSNGSLTRFSWRESGVEVASGPTPRVSLRIGVHEIELYVTDEEGLTASDSIVVTVRPALSASAGPDQRAATVGSDGATITLTGQASGGLPNYTFVWSLENRELSRNSVLTVTLPNGEHRIDLAVTDSRGITVFSHARVSVFVPSQSLIQLPRASACASLVNQCSPPNLKDFHVGVEPLVVEGILQTITSKDSYPTQRIILSRITVDGDPEPVQLAVIFFSFNPIEAIEWSQDRVIVASGPHPRLLFESGNHVLRVDIRGVDAVFGQFVERIEFKLVVQQSANVLCADTDDALIVQPGETVALRGRAAGGAEPHSYSWLQDASNLTRVELQDANQPTASFVVPDDACGYEFVFVLTVTDATGGSDVARGHVGSICK